MSADEELTDLPAPRSPSLEGLGGEGAASEQEASFQMAVWSLLHDAPEELPGDDVMLRDADEEQPIDDEPQGILPDSVLEEELERAWYSQAEDTEVSKSSSAWEVVPPVEAETQSQQEPGSSRILPIPSKVVSSQLEASSELRRAEHADEVSYKRRCLQAPKLPWEVGCGARFLLRVLRGTEAARCCLRLGWMTSGLLRMLVLPWKRPRFLQ